jgi:hypothetical protein
MPKSRTESSHASKELFRYVELGSPNNGAAAAVLAQSPQAQQQWAREFLASPAAIKGAASFKTPALAKLGNEVVDGATQPSLKVSSARPNKTLTEDRGNALRTLLAHSLVGQKAEAQKAARWLQVIEASVTGGKAARARPWVPAVLEPFKQNAPGEPSAGAPDLPVKHPQADKRADLHKLRHDITTLWRLHPCAAGARGAR